MEYVVFFKVRIEPEEMIFDESLGIMILSPKIKPIQEARYAKNRSLS